MSAGCTLLSHSHCSNQKTASLFVVRHPDITPMSDGWQAGLGFLAFEQFWTVSHAFRIARPCGQVVGKRERGSTGSNHRRGRPKRGGRTKPVGSGRTSRHQAAPGLSHRHVLDGLKLKREIDTPDLHEAQRCGTKVVQFLVSATIRRLPNPWRPLRLSEHADFA